MSAPKKDSKNDSKNDEAPAAKGSKVVPILGALLLVNLGITGFVLVKGMHKGSPDASHEEKDGKEKDGKGAEKGPPTVVMEPLVVNLNEAESSRYLKATIEIEFNSSSGLEGFTRSKSAVRDQLLRYLSSLTVADTLGEQGKAKIQDGLTARIEKEIGAKQVHRLFYTEFVVQ